MITWDATRSDPGVNSDPNRFNPSERRRMIEHPYRR